VKSFWQKQRFGWACASKTATDFNLREKTIKTPFITHPRFQARWWWEALAFPCHFGIFMRIHMRVPMFLWKHIPNVEIFEHHVCRCGNTSWTHTRSQSLFMSLCLFWNGSVKSRNTCASLFSSLNLRRHTRDSLKQQETPGFEILQRRSLCYHISAAAMLPVKLCSTWAEKLSCHTNHPFPGQKTAIFAILYFCWCICYLMLYLPTYWYNFKMTYTSYSHL